MKYFLVIVLMLFVSCANVSSTRLTFKSETSTLVVEMPKEVEAKTLKINFNAQQGTFEITSESWISRNADTIASQASREKAILESSSDIIAKATSAATRAAIKSVMPIP